MPASGCRRASASCSPAPAATWRDRITQGHVTDFIDVGPWYIFNLADASIVTGIVLFTGFALFSRPSRNEPALVTTTTPGDEEYDG